MADSVEIHNSNDLYEYIHSKIGNIIRSRIHYDNPMMVNERNVLDAVTDEHMWAFYIIYSNMADALIELYYGYNTNKLIDLNRDSTVFEKDNDGYEITRFSLMMWETDYDSKVVEIKSGKRYV
jgi:hypothetical protein